MFKINRAKLMNGPLMGRIIGAATVVGVSSLVGLQTSESYAPGMHPEAKDLNKDPSRVERKVQVTPSVAPPTPKVADLAKKIEEDRKGLAAKKADQDVRREHAGARLDGVLAAHEKAERPGMFDRITGFFSKEPSSAERKAALQNDIAARAQAYMDPKSQASISATGPRKQEGSFWGGAAVTALSLLGASLLFKKLSGRHLTWLAHGHVPARAEYNNLQHVRRVDEPYAKYRGEHKDATPLELKEKLNELQQDARMHTAPEYKFFPWMGKGIGRDGESLTKPITPAARAQFNGQASRPADAVASAPHAPATAPSATQPAAATAYPEPTPTAAASGVNYDVPAVRRRAAAVPPASPPAASAEVVDTSALSTGAAKPAISDVRTKLKDKGMQHGRS